MPKTEPSEGAQQEPRDWLIYDERSECYWGPDRGGYWKSIAHAGLYTEKEAREAEDFAKRYHRREVAVPLSKFGVEIKRLADALAERAAIDTLLGAVQPPPEPSEVERLRAVPPTCASCDEKPGTVVYCADCHTEACRAYVSAHLNHAVSPTDERLRALARDMAIQNHIDQITCVPGRNGHAAGVDGVDDENLGFATCPHPDCVLVRAVAEPPKEPT